MMRCPSLVGPQSVVVAHSVCMMRFEVSQVSSILVKGQRDFLFKHSAYIFIIITVPSGPTTSRHHWSAFITYLHWLPLNYALHWGFYFTSNLGEVSFGSIAALRLLSFHRRFLFSPSWWVPTLFIMHVTIMHIAPGSSMSSGITQ